MEKTKKKKLKKLLIYHLGELFFRSFIILIMEEKMFTYSNNMYVSPRW